MKFLIKKFTHQIYQCLNNLNVQYIQCSIPYFLKFNHLLKFIPLSITYTILTKTSSPWNIILGLIRNAMNRLNGHISIFRHHIVCTVLVLFVLATMCCALYCMYIQYVYCRKYALIRPIFWFINLENTILNQAHLENSTFLDIPPPQRYLKNTPRGRIQRNTVTM